MSFKATGRAGVPASNVAAVVLSFNVDSAGIGGVRINWNPYTNSSNAMFHTDGSGSLDSGVVIVVPDANGRINLTAFGAGSYHVFADVVGYFTIPPTTTYTYSGDGLRRTKTASDGTVTTFTWDRARGLPLLLAEAIDAPGGATNDRTVRYLYGPDGLVVADVTTPSTGAETIRWYHHDQLGSTVALTDSTGTTISTYKYSPYGELVASTGTATTPMGWAGEYRDSETGYIYLRARYYDSSTGQFLTRDPAGLLTRSAYGYVHGNPINRIDPSGLFPGEGILGDAWDATGGRVASWANKNRAAFASLVSMVGYGLCPVTSGIGCAIGYAGSAISLGISANRAFDVCGSDGVTSMNCAMAGVDAGLSAVGTFGPARSGLIYKPRHMAPSLSRALTSGAPYDTRDVNVLFGVGTSGLSALGHVLTDAVVAC
jgi:RHS repeat-associated protein